ncbi:MAG: hypothetical protein KF805_11375 [Phycisphaeraceae bacterium]|nr:hypothetical protein [Phycisphaeraceae bacterium]
MHRAVLTSCRVLSAALWALGALLLFVWLVGRVFNDSFRWSQYIFWIPTAFTILMAGLTCALALSLQFFIRGYEQLQSGGPPENRPPFYIRYAKNPFLLLCIAWFFCAAWSGIFEHKMLREWGLDFSDRRRNQPTNTLLFWNLGGSARANWMDQLRLIDADVVALSNRPNWATFKDFESLGKDADGKRQRTTFLAGTFMVNTRLTLREWGLTALNIEGGVGFDVRKQSGRYNGNDPGYAMYLIFDPEGTVKQATGQPFVVWLMDLPSDPSLSRQHVTTQALAAIDAWRGTATVLSAEPDSKGEPQWINVPAEQLGRKGFPLPDVMMGDFNIPRGSRSLQNLVGDMENAYDQAGSGYTASYPRKVPFSQLDGPGLFSVVRFFIPSDVPFFHIDQAFIAPSLHATRYRVMNLGAGTHWAQFIEIQAR